MNMDLICTCYLTTFSYIIDIGQLLPTSYSLSDLVRLTAFSSFFPQKVRFCLPNLANLLVALPRVCINILFVSTPQNVANFTMGPNGQNRYFAELRQKVCLDIHALVLLKY